MFHTTRILVLLVGFVAAVQCEGESFLPLVTGGTPTLPGQAPYVVSIRRPLDVGQTANTYCSGTIVNANHIVTAVTCVHDATFHLINPFWFRIIAGDLNIVNPSFQRFTTSPSHIYTHPGYTFNPSRNNVAVMRTMDSFPFPHNHIDWAVRNTRPLPIGQVREFNVWINQQFTRTDATNPGLLLQAPPAT